MKRRHKKQVRVAMIVVLTATVIAYSTGNLFAQSDDMISENTGIEVLESEESVQNIGKVVSGVAIDETNFPDAEFRQYISANFDYDNDGILSSNEIHISTIDVNDNQNIKSLQGIELFPDLYHLYCANTGITELDISSHYLGWFDCSNTGITKLDISSSSGLRELNCSNTGITELDLSKNTHLMWLYCQNTGITSLDLSNTMLGDLNASGNNLAWLNIGDNSRLYNISMDDSKIDIVVDEDTFNIVDTFSGIDPNKITIISGASLDKATGIVSGYTYGTPITYTYDCGVLSNGTVVELSVSLNVRGRSTITVNDSLDKVYDGQAVAEPQVTVTGSTGIVNYQWYTVDGVELGSAPSEVGSYRLVITVGEDSNYNGVTTEVVFMIKEAQSNNPPAIEDTNNSSESNNKEEWNESIGNQVSGVQTGDITKVGLWTLLVGVSIGFMLFFIKKNRKED